MARRGHTEAAVGATYAQVLAYIACSYVRTDLCSLAGLPPLGLLCEIVKPDDPKGSMARRDDCYAFAKQHGLRMITIEALEAYRRQSEDLVNHSK